MKDQARWIACCALMSACGGETMDIAVDAGADVEVTLGSHCTEDPGPARIVSNGSRLFIQDEPSIAATSNGRIVVVWQGLAATGGYVMAYALSEDFGRTFSAPK